MAIKYTGQFTWFAHENTSGNTRIDSNNGSEDQKDFLRIDKRADAGTETTPGAGQEESRGFVEFKIPPLPGTHTIPDGGVSLALQIWNGGQSDREVVFTEAVFTSSQNVNNYTWATQPTNVGQFQNYTITSPTATEYTWLTVSGTSPLLNHPNGTYFLLRCEKVLWEIDALDNLHDETINYSTGLGPDRFNNEDCRSPWVAAPSDFVPGCVRFYTDGDEFETVNPIYVWSDTYTREQFPGSENERVGLMYAKYSTSGDNRDAYLLFDFTKVRTASGHENDNLTLNLFASSYNGAPKIDVHSLVQATKPWSGSNVNWNNAPSHPTEEVNESTSLHGTTANRSVTLTGLTVADVAGKWLSLRLRMVGTVDGLFASWYTSSAVGAYQSDQIPYLDGFTYTRIPDDITNTTITLDPAAITTTGYAPTAEASQGNIPIPVGSATLTGYAPTAVATDLINVTVPVGSAATTGYAPEIDNPQGMTVPAGSASATGYAPTIDASDVVSIEVPTASATATGYAPDIDNPQGMTVPTGAANATGYEPDVFAATPADIQVPNGTIVLSGYAPTTDVTNFIAVTVPVANAQMVGQTPLIELGIVFGLGGRSTGVVGTQTTSAVSTSTTNAVG